MVGDKNVGGDKTAIDYKLYHNGIHYVSTENLNGISDYSRLCKNLRNSCYN